MFDPTERDGSNDPAIYLRARLQELGYRLELSDNHSLADCEWVFFYDAISVKTYSGWRGMARRLKAMLQDKPLLRALFDECLRAGLEQRMALFLWEAPAVSPGNWNPELHKLFPFVFTWNDRYVDGRKFIKMCLPQTERFPHVPEMAFEDRKLLVNISMNKTSNHPRELYTARRISIRHFQQHQPENFDLYGVGWDRPAHFLERAAPFTRAAYPSYRGTVQNKWDVLPRYRFSLCYENIRDEPGYVTEKIFDCMRARCVPIYWGATNITEYVEAEAFVDRRCFKSDAELEEYLSNVSEREYAQYQRAIQSYLASKRFEQFLPPAYADTIIRTLNLSS